MQSRQGDFGRYIPRFNSNDRHSANLPKLITADVSQKRSRTARDVISVGRTPFCSFVSTAGIFNRYGSGAREHFGIALRAILLSYKWYLS